MPWPTPEALNPAPSGMPPPTNKRPRPSSVTASAAATSAATGTTAAQPRPKRRKADDGPVGTDTADGRRGASGAGARAKSGAAVGAAGVGSRDTDRDAGRGRGDDDDDGGEVREGEIVTKLDFNDLPDETLYKYLEVHDLLPRWDPTPWDDQRVTQPQMLYSTRPSTTTSGSPHPGSGQRITSRSGSNAPSNARAPSVAASDTRASVAGGPDAGGGSQLGEGDEPDLPAPPTTRSKTAPTRKQASPTRASPYPEDKTQVMTLSDVQRAREILAEKANQHWVKGLGGGQNKESETIVQFLYKMKVGPGRLLRVYNPAGILHQ